MQIIFLGTSCAIPTKERNHSCIALRYHDEIILFDCGEGTQRQLKIAKLKPTKINKIFISHWHGDHVIGLLGLIQTLTMADYNKTLHIFGPKGTKKYLNNLLHSCIADIETIKIECNEVSKGKILETSLYYIETLPLEHRCPTNGYAFIEKPKRKIKIDVIKKLGIPEGPLLGKLQSGKSITWRGKRITPDETTYLTKGRKVTYIADTIPCKNAFLLSKDADVLICDSTYASDMKEKALEYKHMTAADAAQLASKANAKQLILTHFSTRYKDVSVLKEDASKIFPNTIAAEDFMKITL